MLQITCVTTLMRISHPPRMKIYFISYLDLFFKFSILSSTWSPERFSFFDFSTRKEKVLSIDRLNFMTPLYASEPHSFCFCWRTWQFCPCLSFGPMLLHTLVEFCWFHCCLTNYHLRKSKNCMMLGLMKTCWMLLSIIVIHGRFSQLVSSLW